MLYAGGVEWGNMCQLGRTLLGRITSRVATRWREESGAELFEAALVIPLLLMLLLGIISFGRAYNEYQTITRAAREGARELVLTNCATCGNSAYTALEARTNFVEPAMQASSVDPTKITNYTTTYVNLDVSPGTTSTGCTATSPCICGVQIAFQYPYTFSLPFTTLNFSTINLPVTVQMRLENPPDPASCTGSVP